jgi:hypothetical protein
MKGATNIHARSLSALPIHFWGEVYETGLDRVVYR